MKKGWRDDDDGRGDGSSGSRGEAGRAGTVMRRSNGTAEAEMRRGRDGEHRGNLTRIVDRRIAIPAFGKDARRGRKMERNGIQAELRALSGQRTQVLAAAETGRQRRGR